MTTFDYNSTAELFAAKSRWPRRQQIEYRRFGSAAEAIRFAIEELPPDFLAGAYLEVDEERFDSTAIRRRSALLPIDELAWSFGGVALIEGTVSPFCAALTTMRTCAGCDHEKIPLWDASSVTAPAVCGSSRGAPASGNRRRVLPNSRSE
jgi:hypothetical protein